MNKEQEKIDQFESFEAKDIQDLDRSKTRANGHKCTRKHSEPHAKINYQNFLKVYKPDGKAVYKTPFLKENFAKFSVSTWRQRSLGYQVQFQYDDYHIVRNEEGDGSI